MFAVVVSILVVCSLFSFGGLCACQAGLLFSVCLQLVVFRCPFVCLQLVVVRCPFVCSSWCYCCSFDHTSVDFDSMLTVLNVDGDQTHSSFLVFIEVPVVWCSRFLIGVVWVSLVKVPVLTVCLGSRPGVVCKWFVSKRRKPWWRLCKINQNLSSIIDGSDHAEKHVN